MNVQTTRFGEVEVDDQRIITFTSGLLGFASHKSYVLLQPDEDSVFFWLQSTDAPELAFVVTDPAIWVQDYEVPIRREQAEELEITAVKEAQVLVIVNKRENTLTANLQGPLIINSETRAAQQLVLAEKRWTTRHQILELKPQVRAASA